jgi:hypothetical protein
MITHQKPEIVESPITNSKITNSQITNQKCTYLRLSAYICGKRCSSFTQLPNYSITKSEDLITSSSDNKKIVF